LEHRHPTELSLGQQQRVALARALSRSAQLTLLDEPFSALDTPLRSRLRQELLELQQEVDATMILVTHHPDDAILLADELLLLDAGRVLQYGPVSSIFRRPANESVVRLLGVENIAHGRAVAVDRIDVGNGVELFVGGPPLRPGARIGWSVRSERIRFAKDAPYPALIIGSSDVRDGQRTVTIQLGKAMLQVMLDPSDRTHGPCKVGIDPDALQIWPAPD
jgi:molybdate transport system permease protein